MATSGDNLEQYDSSEEKEHKDVKTIQKELLENVNTLNSMISGAVKDDDSFVHRVNEKENPYDDGEGGLVQVKRGPERRLIDVLLTDRRKNVPSFGFPQPYANSGMFNLVSSRNGGEKRHEKTSMEMESSNRMSGTVGEYEDRTFIMYRSKNKMMPSTCDVYDVGSVLSLLSHLIIIHSSLLVDMIHSSFPLITPHSLSHFLSHSLFHSLSLSFPLTSQLSSITTPSFTFNTNLIDCGRCILP